MLRSREIEHVPFEVAPKGLPMSICRNTPSIARGEIVFHEQTTFCRLLFGAFDTRTGKEEVLPF